MFVRRGGLQVSQQVIIGDDFARELRRISDRLYPGIEYGPTKKQFNVHRLTGFRGAGSYLDAAFGRDQRNNAQWAQLLEAAGLQYPPVTESRYANVRFEERASGLYDAPMAPERRDEGGDGIKVVPHRRTVFEWQRLIDADGKSFFGYAPAGHIETYMVR